MAHLQTRISVNPLTSESEKYPKVFYLCTGICSKWYGPQSFCTSSVTPWNL